MISNAEQPQSQVGQLHTPTTSALQSCLDRLRQGDEAARKELLNVSCERLRCLAHEMFKDYARLRRWEETADVLQNALLRLYRALQTVTPPTLRDFYRLAALEIRRELLDLARHYFGPQGEGKHHHSQGDSAREGSSCATPADPTLEPADLAHWTEFHQQASALPDEEREVFELIWYQGLAQTEAAELLGVCARTIKSPLAVGLSETARRLARRVTGTMTTEDRIADILLQWDELREQGQDVPAEDLCREHPELVEEVRRRIQALQAMYRIPNGVGVPPSGGLPGAEDRLKAELQPNGSPATATTAPDPSPLPESSWPRILDCEILGLLGSGGMGKVYQARQLRLKRLVAVKVILTGANSASDVKRFRVEAEAVARLQHPNIVQIHAVGESNGCPYLVLEYVAGGTLADRLRSGPLPARQTADLVLTLARAIHFAHQRQIIHRDLKPANILLQRRSSVGDSLPKIADFGLAKFLVGDSPPEGTSSAGGLTLSGSVLGTPNYMAPEQAEGLTQQVGPLTDVYGLGTILYECLTGQPPFPPGSLLATLERVRSESPVAPRRLSPEVPLDLETVCLKCLDKEPERRYLSAEALADDLQRYLDGEPIQARLPNAIDWLTWTLNRSREVPVSRMPLFWLGLAAPFPFLAQLLAFVLASLLPKVALWYGWIALGVMLVCVASLILSYLILSGEGFRVPLNATTRHLWSMRVGMILGLLILPILDYRLHAGSRLSAWDPLRVFPSWAVLVGVTFFALGGMFWGRLYLCGLGFLVLALLMPLRLEWGPLALAALVSLTLWAMIRHVQQTRRDGEAG